MSDDETIRGLVDLVATLRHDVNELQQWRRRTLEARAPGRETIRSIIDVVKARDAARVEAREGKADPEPEASAYLARPDVARLMEATRAMAEAERLRPTEPAVFGVFSAAPPLKSRPDGDSFHATYVPPVADACTDEGEAHP